MARIGLKYFRYGILDEETETYDGALQLGKAVDCKVSSPSAAPMSPLSSAHLSDMRQKYGTHHHWLPARKQWIS